MFGTKLNETKIFERRAICVRMLKIHAWTYLAAGPCPLDLVLKMLHVKRLINSGPKYVLAEHAYGYVLFTLLNIGYHLKVTNTYPILLEYYSVMSSNSFYDCV